MSLTRWPRGLSALRPAVYLLNTGSCNGCDAELTATWGPRYDAERFGFRRVARPEEADILVITGPVASGSRTLVEQIAQHLGTGDQIVVAVGACALSCGPYAGCSAVEGPVERYLPVDVRVAGCPPKPQALLDALLEARDLLARGRKETEVEASPPSPAPRRGGSPPDATPGDNQSRP